MIRLFAITILAFGLVGTSTADAGLFGGRLLGGLRERCGGRFDRDDIDIDIDIDIDDDDDFGCFSRGRSRCRPVFFDRDEIDIDIDIDIDDDDRFVRRRHRYDDDEIDIDIDIDIDDDDRRIIRQRCRGGRCEIW